MSSRVLETIVPAKPGETIWQGFMHSEVTRPLEQEFTGTSGVSDEVLDCEESIDFFRLIFSEQLVSMIVFYTNLYAEQELERMSPLPKHSRFRKWRPVTSDEIYLYVAFVCCNNLHKNCLIMLFIAKILLELP